MDTGVVGADSSASGTVARQQYKERRLVTGEGEAGGQDLGGYRHQSLLSASKHGCLVGLGCDSLLADRGYRKRVGGSRGCSCTIGWKPPVVDEDEQQWIVADAPANSGTYAAWSTDDCPIGTVGTDTWLYASMEPRGVLSGGSSRKQAATQSTRRVSTALRS